PPCFILATPPFSPKSLVPGSLIWVEVLLFCTAGIEGLYCVRETEDSLAPVSFRYADLSLTFENQDDLFGTVLHLPIATTRAPHDNDIIRRILNIHRVAAAWKQLVTHPALRRVIRDKGAQQEERGSAQRPVLASVVNQNPVVLSDEHATVST